ncbi:hypothetical protein ACIQY8_25750 [Streptomyces albidoflavus]
MTTKTKTISTFAERVAEADVIGAEKAADARAKLSELKDNIARFEEEYDDASARVRWMHSNFERGTECASPEDYAAALARVARARFLTNRHKVDRDGVVVADRRVELAEKRLPASEKRLASVVADALKGALPGAQILTTFGKVTAEPTEAELPIAVVSQSLPTVNDVYGQPGEGGSVTSGLFLSGEVTVTLYRKPEHKELYPAKISKHLARQGVTLMYAESMANAETSTVARGAYELDTLNLTIRSVDNPLASPELRELYERRVSNTRLSDGSTRNVSNTFASMGR